MYIDRCLVYKYVGYAYIVCICIYVYVQVSPAFTRVAAFEATVSARSQVSRSLLLLVFLGLF